MKRSFCALAALVLCFLFPLGPLAQWEPPFEVPADEGLLINLDTGEVVWQQDADEPHAIASLTKMMTGLLLLESGEDLNTVVTIPQRLEEEFETIKEWDGAYLDLKVGEEISLNDLLYAMLLPSTNDSASAIADYLSGGDIPAFVEQMNRRAAELGCENTRFSCPHGLYDEGNYSTARDLARIAGACMENQTFMEVVTTPSFWLPFSNMHTAVQTPDAPEGMYLKLSSTIQLQLPASPLYREYARGLKTGFTDAAGRCFVTTAAAGGENYLLVFLGMPNQKDSEGIQVYFGYAAQLLDWAFDTFQVGGLPSTAQALTTLPLFYCKEADSLPLYPTAPLSGCLINGGQELTYRFELPQSLAAPLSQGQVVGSAQVWQGERLLGSVELAAGQDFAYSARLYWRERLAPWRGWLLAAGVFLVLLLAAVLLLALRVRQVKRRRARRRCRRR